MVATFHSFNDPLPPTVYVDTDVFINYFNDKQPYYQRTVAFVERLFAKAITLYYSPLTRLEFAHVITRHDLRAALPLARQQALKLHDWPYNAQVRQAYIRTMLSDIDSLLALFNATEVLLTSTVLDEAFVLMGRHKLGSQDAVHLASAKLAGVRDFASFDKAFQNVDGLQLWNDLTHQ